MDTLFDRDFYPTPREVIDRMLINVDVSGKTVLEPSAGSGSIVDVLNEYGAAHVKACETNGDLRRLLTTKCEVIADDFLTVTADDVADVQLIVANVPFSHQSEHIAHMLDIAPDGCEIVTLCNSTLFDHWHRTKKDEEMMEKIDRWGFTETLGSVFSKSDRPTDVSVGLIHVFKPGSGDNMFTDYFTDEADEELRGSGIVQYNEVRDWVNRYVEAVRRFDEVMAANNGINDLIAVFGSTGLSFGAFEYNARTGHNNPVSADLFRKHLQQKAWRHVFDKMNMGKYLTKSTMRDLDAAISRQENFPFTMKNIFRMLEMIVGTHQDRMKKCITEAFDKICSHSPENSTAGEKWKTNSDYMINRKFIMPYICSTFLAGSTVNVSWESSVMMDDIVKALCAATGTNYDSIGSQLYEEAKRHPWGEKFEWTFFICRGFKKGTMHFEFKDEDTWAVFNRTVAEIRGWKLPCSTRNSGRNEFRKRA